ncbi:MAG: hypothetical protein ABJF04_23730 [Reichenbachiella sp.]|uniref:hypothetical protein n=1 Tax=Reichenbachiella sp. TaxID=2184521 RepID=UPI0032669417
MKGLLHCCLVLVIIIWLPAKSSAQRYSLKISSANFNLGGESFQGYSTLFDQSYKEVKKEWWRYVNSRTIIFNKKTHLELTVPAQKRNSNTPLKFVSQLKENKESKSSTLRVALATDGIPDNQIDELKSKVRHLILDFKVGYFTRLIQNKIEVQETTSQKISIEMDKYLLSNSKLQQWIDKKPEDKDKFIEKLATNTRKIEKLQNQLNHEQAQLVKLKKELTLIK